MKIKTVAGPLLLVCMLAIIPLFAIYADMGRNSLYEGFSCKPTGPVQVGVPIPLELTVFQNADLKRMGVDNFNVSVWTYGNIEYTGPMNFKIALVDSQPYLFTYAVVVQPADHPDSVRWAGVTFILTSDQMTTTNKKGDRWEMIQHSYFWQFADSMSFTPGAPRVAQWARLGVPEWVKNSIRGLEHVYTIDSVTGVLVKKPPKLRPSLPIHAAPPDTGIRKISKEDAARSEMRMMERFPLEDEERQLIEIGGVWYERNRGETKFRLAEVITDIKEYLNNKRLKNLEMKTRVVLDLRDSLAYRNAVKIIGEDKLKSTDSVGFFEATLSGYLKIELDEVGITIRRIRSNQKSPKINDRTIMREEKVGSGEAVAPEEANRADIYFEGFEQWDSFDGGFSWFLNGTKETGVLPNFQFIMSSQIIPDGLQGFDVMFFCESAPCFWVRHNGNLWTR